MIVFKERGVLPSNQTASFQCGPDPSFQTQSVFSQYVIDPGTIFLNTTPVRSISINDFLANRNSKNTIAVPLIPRSPAGYRPSQQAGGTRAPCARRPGIASWPGSDLVVPFWRAPGERHRAPCRNPAIPRGNSWHHRQHGEPVRVRSRPAGHDGRVISAPCHALEQRAEGLRWCVCSVPAPPFRDGFCARRTKPPALDAQVCCEASFLAQPALCMHSSRAHYPAVRLERTDHGRLPFLACTRCPLFRSPPVVFGKVDTGVLCPSYFRTHHTICLSQHPVSDTWVLRITVAWSLCARTMFHQDLFCVFC